MLHVPAGRYNAPSRDVNPAAKLRSQAAIGSMLSPVDIVCLATLDPDADTTIPQTAAGKPKSGKL